MNKIAILLVAFTMVMACGEFEEDGTMTVTVSPKEPIVIPEGSTTVGGKEITAPWFEIRKINVTWNGTGTASIVNLTLTSRVRTSTNQSQDFTCSIAGDTLDALFASNYTSGQILISPSTTAPSVTSFVCSGFPIPSPIPSQFNIPTTVEVVAAVLDTDDLNETIGRTRARARITLK